MTIFDVSYWMVWFDSIAVPNLFRRVAPTAAKSKPKPKPKAKGKASPKPKVSPKAKATRGRKTQKHAASPKSKEAKQKTPRGTAKKPRAKAAAKKTAAKPKAKAKGLKMDTNNCYSRAYHAAKRKGLCKEEVGPLLSEIDVLISNGCLWRYDSTQFICK